MVLNLTPLTFKARYNKIVVHQDNQSVILLENNRKLSSSGQTKHINVQCFFIKNCIDRKQVKIEFCGTTPTGGRGIQ